MKKIFISILAVAMTMSAAATVQTQVTLTLASASESNSIVIVVTDDASETAYTAPLYEGALGAPQVTPYVLVGGTKYQTYITTDENLLNDLPIGFKTSSETDYTLTVSELVGNVKFIDPKTGAAITLTGSESWNLTATEIAAAAVRINPSAVQTEFVCQVPAGLSFHGDQDYTGLQVLDENDQVVEAAFDLAAGEDKVVAIATAGRYYVLNGTQKIFFVVR